MNKLLKNTILALAGISTFVFATAQPVTAADTNTITAAKGDKLFTRFALFYENNIHRTTNYRKGVFVPINTPVTFVKANKTEIDVTLPDGSNLEIENVQKFSGEDIVGIFNRTFGKAPEDLSHFTDA